MVALTHFIYIHIYFPGRTLLMNAVATEPLTDEIYEQIVVLIKDKGANVNIIDKQGFNCVSDPG